MLTFPSMGEGPRVFTIDEANALVSSLELEFGHMVRIRAELAPLIRALGGAQAAVAVLADDGKPPHGLEGEAERLRALAADVTSAIERVNGHGCLVKDVDLGLVDFYTVQDGEPVFLCWQFGEPGVTHWHSLDEGYAARKPIPGAGARQPPHLN